MTVTGEKRWYRPGREAQIIQAIRDWHAMFGAPPGSTDWKSSNRRRSPTFQRRYESTGRAWPSYSNAQRWFGSWNAAITAAGFTPREPGRPRGTVTPARDEIAERLQALRGREMTTAEIGCATGRRSDDRTLRDTLDDLLARGLVTRGEDKRWRLAERRLGPVRRTRSMNVRSSDK